MTDENIKELNDIKREIMLLIAKYGGRPIGADILTETLAYIKQKYK